MASIAADYSAYRLLSEFYILLWGELDALSDDHRWLRSVSDKLPALTAQTRLDALEQQALEERLPVPVSWLRADFSSVSELRARAIEAPPRMRVELAEPLASAKRRFQDLSLRFALVPASHAPRALLVEFEPEKIREALRALTALSGVREVHQLEAPVGVIIIEPRDAEALQTLLLAIERIPGIKHVHWYPIVDVWPDWSFPRSSFWREE